MILTSRPAPTLGGRRSRGVPLQRVASLARAEILLLRRNPYALLTAAVIPVVLVLLFRLSVPPELAQVAIGANVVTSLTGATLILVVYYNLVKALVARREELVLKRLRVGELSDAEILAGVVAPAVLIAWAQILVGVLAAAVFLDLPTPTHPVLALAGLAGGTGVFVLLAVVSTVVTSNVQIAELTTTPVLLGSMVLSGMIFPLAQLPEPLQRLGQVMPLTPVVELIRLGLTGSASGADGVAGAAGLEAGVVPLLVLAGWLAAGMWIARRWFRWEPRR